MSLYKQPGSELWWMDFTVKGHPRVRESTHTSSRDAAQVVEDDRKAVLRKQPALKGKTWSDAVDSWMTKKKPSDTEVKGIFKFCRYYGDRALLKVSAEDIEEALDQYCDTNATFNRHLARILGILKMSSVTVKVPKRSVDVTPERMSLTREQWAALYEALPAHQKAMALFSIETGLRQANVLNLRWNKVNWPLKMVYIERHTAKAKKSLGIPLSDKALEVLTAQRGQHDEFVFTYDGRPITEIKTAFIKACCRAGVGRLVRADDPTQEVEWLSGERPAGTAYEGFVWHGLRHTWATWHIQSGFTSLEVLQRLGGWADYKMVLVYAALHPGYLAQHANNIKVPDQPVDPVVQPADGL